MPRKRGHSPSLLDEEFYSKKQNVEFKNSTTDTTKPLNHFNNDPGTSQQEQHAPATNDREKGDLFILKEIQNPRRNNLSGSSSRRDAPQPQGRDSIEDNRNRLNPSVALPNLASTGSTSRNDSLSPPLGASAEPQSSSLSANIDIEEDPNFVEYNGSSSTTVVCPTSKCAEVPVWNQEDRSKRSQAGNDKLASRDNGPAFSPEWNWSSAHGPPSWFSEHDSTENTPNTVVEPPSWLSGSTSSHPETKQSCERHENVEGKNSTSRCSSVNHTPSRSLPENVSPIRNLQSEPSDNIQNGLNGNNGQDNVDPRANQYVEKEVQPTNLGSHSGASNVIYTPTPPSPENVSPTRNLQSGPSDNAPSSNGQDNVDTWANQYGQKEVQPTNLGGHLGASTSPFNKSFIPTPRSHSNTPTTLGRGHGIAIPYNNNLSSYSRQEPMQNYSNSQHRGGYNQSNHNGYKENLGYNQFKRGRGSNRVPRGRGSYHFQRGRASNHFQTDSGRNRDLRESSSRGERNSRGRTPERNSSGRTPERNSRGRTPERNSSGRTPERNSRGRTPERNLSGRTPERNSRGHTPERNSKGRYSERSSTRHTPERNSKGRYSERSSTRHTPERSSTRHTPERNSTRHTPERSSTRHTPERSSTRHTPERSSRRHTPERSSRGRTPSKHSSKEHSLDRKRSTNRYNSKDRHTSDDDDDDSSQSSLNHDSKRHTPNLDTKKTAGTDKCSNMEVPKWNTAEELLIILKTCNLKNCKEIFPTKEKAIQHMREEHNMKRCMVCFVPIKYGQTHSNHFIEMHAERSGEKAKCPFPDCTSGRLFYVSGMLLHLTRAHFALLETKAKDDKKSGQNILLKASSHDSKIYKPRVPNKPQPLSENIEAKDMSANSSLCSSGSNVSPSSNSVQIIIEVKQNEELQQSTSNPGPFHQGMRRPSQQLKEKSQQDVNKPGVPSEKAGPSRNIDKSKLHIVGKKRPAENDIEKTDSVPLSKGSSNRIPLSSSSGTDNMPSCSKGISQSTSMQRQINVTHTPTVTKRRVSFGHAEIAKNKVTISQPNTSAPAPPQSGISSNTNGTEARMMEGSNALKSFKIPKITKTKP